MTLDCAVGAEAEGGKALAIVELEDGCGDRHDIGWKCTLGYCCGWCCYFVVKDVVLMLMSSSTLPRNRAPANGCTFLIGLRLSSPYSPLELGINASILHNFLKNRMTLVAAVIVDLVEQRRNLPYLSCLIPTLPVQPTQATSPAPSTFHPLSTVSDPPPSYTIPPQSPHQGPSAVNTPVPLSPD